MNYPKRLVSRWRVGGEGKGQTLRRHPTGRRDPSKKVKRCPRHKKVQGRRRTEEDGCESGRGIVGNRPIGDESSPTPLRGSLRVTGGVKGLVP